uniref:Uncharacterized protein n=1 Tax=Anopheles farauti TaxID=69004 RepID=A0A182QEX7_9DIPT
MDRSFQSGTLCFRNRKPFFSANLNASYVLRTFDFSIAYDSFAWPDSPRPYDDPWRRSTPSGLRNQSCTSSSCIVMRWSGFTVSSERTKSFALSLTPNHMLELKSNEPRCILSVMISICFATDARFSCPKNCRGVNGACPHSIVYRMTPSDHKSVVSSEYDEALLDVGSPLWLILLNTSGAAYPSVPAGMYGSLPSPSSRWANPKSIKRNCCESACSKRIFSGFRSRRLAFLGALHGVSLTLSPVNSALKFRVSRSFSATGGNGAATCRRTSWVQLIVRRNG